MPKPWHGVFDTFELLCSPKVTQDGIAEKFEGLAGAMTNIRQSTITVAALNHLVEYGRT
jgi:hypothetical protein